VILDDGRFIGQLFALSRIADAVDAHLVVLAIRLGHSILTGDVDDIGHIADTLGPSKPSVQPWP
jgi:hypothetical protein